MEKLLKIPKCLFLQILHLRQIRDNLNNPIIFHSNAVISFYVNAHHFLLVFDCTWLQKSVKNRQEILELIYKNVFKKKDKLKIIIAVDKK